MNHIGARGFEQTTSGENPDTAPAIDERPWYEVVVLPALLRHARHTYGSAMRRALESSGYGDIPGNGLYVIGAMFDSSQPFAQIVDEAVSSKPAGERLIDALLQRGYIERAGDAGAAPVLSERGRAAAGVMRAARDGVDHELTERVGAESVLQTRRTLAALIGLNPGAD